MSNRNGTYNAIRRLLADGRWHDAQELETVTRYARDWVAELSRDPDVEVKEDRGKTLIRHRAPTPLSA